jgi:tetratricopeptide (TPR) repeat protein
MENEENTPPLGSSIVFLSVPESLRSRMDALHHQHHHQNNEEEPEGPDHDEDEYGNEADESGFWIDPAIPIPVELPPGETAANLEQLSWEMIISGMLKVIAAHEFRTNPLGGSFPLPAGSPGTGQPADFDAGDIDYYRRFVLAVRPNILGEFTEAAIIHARNHSFESALEILGVLRGLFPDAPEPLLNLALALEKRADTLDKAGREAEAEAEYQKAHEVYRELLAADEPFPNGLFNAGYFYIKRRNFGKARECFAAYVPLAEDDEKKARAGAIVREIAGQSLDDEIFREAYDFIRLGDEQKGLERIRDFLERHGAVWNGWFLLGWGLRKQGRWSDGEAAFRRAVELGGENSDTLNELAICLMEQENYTGARKELEKALRREPENVKIISNLGVLAIKTGDDDEAAGFFRTALEIEPDDVIARQYLEELRG